MSWLSTEFWDSGSTPVIVIYLLLPETLRPFEIYSRSSRMDSPLSMPFPKLS